nr:ABC transporter substrate-binding protein [Haloferax sp. BAB-2207]
MTTESVPGNFTQVLYVNLMESEGNPMSNRHNRRAVLFGIDREEILDEVFYGQGAVQKGPWYPDSDWTSPKLKEMQMYDPEKAKKELELAGNPDGFEMDIIATKARGSKTRPSSSRTSCLKSASKPASPPSTSPRSSTKCTARTRGTPRWKTGRSRFRSPRRGSTPATPTTTTTTTTGTTRRRTSKTSTRRAAPPRPKTPRATSRTATSGTSRSSARRRPRRTNRNRRKSSGNWRSTSSNTASRSTSPT